MKKILGFSEESYNDAIKIVKTLRSEGHRAFFVGGCVRDALLSLEPDEIDITTSATPSEVQNLFKRTVPIGESFGVVLVLEGDNKFEVATFRNESEYRDGRRPSVVTYSEDEKEDVIRRDFTINGLLYDPLENRIFDHVDGLNDLDSGVVRTIGNPLERFGEDKLRMVRAVRFASRYEFKIENSTYSAIRSMAGDILSISVERIREEVLKIITRKNPGSGLGLLQESGLLQYILPEVENMKGVEQPPQFHPEGDVFTHTCLVLDKLYENTGGEYSAELAMGALLHDIGKPPTYEVLDRIRFNGHDRIGAGMARTICKRFRFSKKQIARISEIVRDHLKFKDAKKMRESTLKRFMATPYFEEHMEMHLADCMASHGITDVYQFLKEKQKEYSEIEIKPPPLINGNDLIELGFKPGPIFSEILNDVEEKQLEGTLTDKEAALRFVTERFLN